MTEKTILFVEDEHGIRNSARFLLEMEGYQVLTASNGREALELLSKSMPPGLIVLDLMMPKMNGWEFLEARQKDPVLQKIPVVVLTGTITSKNKLPDVAAVMKKPTDFGDMLKIIDRFHAPTYLH